MTARNDIRTSGKSRRTTFLLLLDVAMFLLVVVLESLQLTGLTWHEWLGFVLCPLVLLHVVLQWPWFVTAIKRALAPGAFRARFNYALNVLLLVLMAAVLVSGVLVSNQVAPLVGDRLGRNFVWSEIHGWLNFMLVLVVAVHLALNWDWILAVLRRRATERPAMAASTGRVAVTLPSNNRVWRSMTRGAAVLLVAAIAATSVYFALAPLILDQRMKRLSSRELGKPAESVAAGRPTPPRRDRPASVPRGLQKLAAITIIVFLVVLISRYALRVHL